MGLVWQPKNKKDASSDKNKEDIPDLIEKKAHSA